MKTIAKTLLLILAFTGIAYYAWGKIAMTLTAVILIGVGVWLTLQDTLA